MSWWNWAASCSRARSTTPTGAPCIALLRRDGFAAVDLGIARDVDAEIEGRLAGGAARCDAVMTSGGVSMGDFDLVKVVLDRIGKMRWMQVAIRPAKPFAFGLVGRPRCSGCPATRCRRWSATRCWPDQGCAGWPAARYRPVPAGRACRRGRWRLRGAGRGRTSPGSRSTVEDRRSLSHDQHRRPGLAPAVRHGPGQGPGHRPPRRRGGGGRRGAGSAPGPVGWGAVASALVDPYNRTVRDLRVSITDRCNFRCQYCMPEEGMKWLPREDLLTYEELTRVAAVCVERFGFESIRLTGGEPTVRAHLPVLVRQLADLGVDLAMTTNGATLPIRPPTWPRPGCDVSISLVTRCAADRFAPSPAGTPSTRSWPASTRPWRAGMPPVKVNCVVVRGAQRRRDPRLRGLRAGQGVELRFIEWMPLDGGGKWQMGQVVPASEIVEAIDARWPLVSPGRAGRQGFGAGGVVHVCGRRRRGGRDRQRDPSVLRVVRSDPPDGGGAAAQLPLLGARDRPAGHTAQRRQRRRPGCSHRGRGGAEVGRALHRRRSISSGPAGA